MSQSVDQAAAATSQSAPTSGLRLSGGAVDMLAGIVLVVVAALFIWVARSFEEPDHTGVGPATFPSAIAVLLLVCGAILAARGVLALAGRVTSETTTIGRPGWVLLGIGLVAIYPIAMTSFGYYVTTAVWLPAFLLTAGYRKPLGIFLLTLGFLAFARVAFEMILGVRLP